MTQRIEHNLWKW